METDGQLLERYARTRDEAAFAEVVRRHGPMVLAGCRRQAGAAAAEDLAQAAFLLLARKAGSLGAHRSVAGWLCGAARLVTGEHLRAEARRRRREKEAVAMKREGEHVDERAREALRPHLDAALAALPERYREPVILLYLEGRERAEVARILDLEPNTLTVRLGRALERLRGLLSRRSGLELSVAGLGPLLAAELAAPSGPAGAQLVDSIMAGMAAAKGAASTPASVLVEAAMKTMFMAKVKLAAAVVGAALAVGGGAVALKLATAAETGKSSLAALDRAGPLEKKWQPLHEFMAALAERDALKWAIPETLAARVIVGGEGVTVRTALDEACKQAKLSWTESNGVVVVHRADDARRKELSDALAAGGSKAAEAAWELGWLRDARAVPALAEALTAKDPAVALAAAQAVEVLCKSVPLGRTDRVDPPLPGRVELSAAFPPKAELAKLLDSPYPALRAAAARLMLGAGGAAAEAAKAKTASDKSFLVEQVRQQALFASGATGKPQPKSDLPPLPKTEEEVKAACDKMFADLPAMGRAADWGRMQRHAQVFAAWANAGSDYAFETMVKCTKFEQANCSWFAPYAQKCLATVGGEKATAKLKESLPGMAHDMVSLILQQWTYGQGMLDFNKPYLGEQSVGYLAARKAGREACDEFLALAAKTDYLATGNYGPVDVLGVIGGPKAVALLKDLLMREEKGSLTLAFRSAKALGQIGGAEALSALLAAADDKERQRRHAVVLFLGWIGGPEALKKLVEVVGKDPDRLVRAGAAAALEEIGAKEALEAAAAFCKADAGPPAAVYQPRNPRFGPEFPVNEWVDLGIPMTDIYVHSEMGWNYDAANKLFFRYGGCTGPYGYCNEFAAFDLGTGRFTERRPTEKTVGWDQRRSPAGCSAGRTWDPYLKVAWLGPAIGNTDAGGAAAGYYNKDQGFGFCSYDFATDRFRSAPYREGQGGEPAKRYAYDWKHGLMLPVKFTTEKEWYTFNTRAANPYAPEAWQAKTNKAGDFPPAFGAGITGGSFLYTTATVHQETGLLVACFPATKDQPAQTWTYDPVANLWKNMQPKVVPEGFVGSGFCYDPFSKMLILQTFKSHAQGFPEGPMTWAYDLKNNTWTDLAPKKPGYPGMSGMGAMDFDPEHNVFVVFGASQQRVLAYRYQNVPAGTKALYGKDQ